VSNKETRDTFNALLIAEMEITSRMPNITPEAKQLLDCAIACQKAGNYKPLLAFTAKRLKPETP
jgi:hypothetical protein